MEGVDYRRLLYRTLKLISGGTFSRDMLAVQLRVPKWFVNVLLNTLLERGYIREERIECSSKACPTCPLKGICRGKPAASPSLKFYALTAKGKEFLERGRECN